MTEPTTQDIALATVWLTGVLDYGERFVIARDRIAAGIAEERRRVLAPVLAEAQDFDAESIMGMTADVSQTWLDAADRIRGAIEGLDSLTRTRRCQTVNAETGRPCVLDWPHDGMHRVADGRWFGTES